MDRPVQSKQYSLKKSDKYLFAVALYPDIRLWPIKMRLVISQSLCLPYRQRWLRTVSHLSNHSVVSVYFITQSVLYSMLCTGLPRQHCVVNWFRQFDISCFEIIHAAWI